MDSFVHKTTCHFLGKIQHSCVEQSFLKQKLGKMSTFFLWTMSSIVGVTTKQIAQVYQLNNTSWIYVQMRSSSNL